MRDIWTYWREFGKGPQKLLRDRSISPRRKAVRAGIVHPGQQRALGDLINMCVGSKVDRAQLFSVVCNDRTRGNKKFCLNTRKNFITEHQNILPRDLVESPCLEILKACRDMVLGSLPTDPAWSRGWTG